MKQVASDIVLRHVMKGRNGWGKIYKYKYKYIYIYMKPLAVPLFLTPAGTAAFIHFYSSDWECKSVKSSQNFFSMSLICFCTL